MKNKNKGITLIALVITIIILLILAGVTISSISGQDGMLSKIEQAKEHSEQAHIQEEIELAIQEFYMEKTEQQKFSEINLENLSAYLSEKLENVVIKELTSEKVASVETTQVVNEKLIIEYKGYEVEINDKFEVNILGKVGLRVEYSFESEEYTKDSVVMTFNISTEQGVTVTSITPLTEGVEVLEANSKFKFTTNGIYKFKILTSDNNERTIDISIDKIDTEAPNVTIEIIEEYDSTKGTLKAKLSVSDAKSGVSLENCKWVLNTDSESIGTEATLYTGEINSEIDEVEMSIDSSTPGDYYIHLLVADKLGNIQEIISDKVATIEGSFATILQPQNYGDPIQYSANDVSDWKVFYSDGSRVYIIASDIIKNAGIPSVGASKVGNYCIQWKNLSYTSRDAEVMKLFKYTASSQTTDISRWDEKVNCALMDTSKWSVYVEDGLTGAEAIGGPTWNLWYASWRAKGYSTISYSTGTKKLTSYDGYSDKLYFPRTTSLADGSNTCYGYQLVHLGSSHTYWTIIRFDYGLFGGAGGTSWNEFGLRPVVCLPEGIKANKNDQGVWVLDKISLNT